ncbi:MAG: fused MFS/spermidine synthase, partial [Saprospiraceae bacterium]
TLGGIITTFLLGFKLIPEYGLTLPAFFYGVFLLMLPALLLLFTCRKYSVGVAGMIVAALLTFSTFDFSKHVSNRFKVLYESEGILGQIKVIDHTSEWYTEDVRMGRGLLVNNTLQTFMDVSNPENSSIWAWSSIIPTALSIYPRKTKVLLLGLGGGTIAKQLNRLGFDYDVVEIDRRIEEVAKTYFHLNVNQPILIDDARHYIRTCKKKYDIVIFDTFLSESAPEHLLTIESFNDVQKVLNPKGMMLANFYGFLNGEKGKAARSVYKTLAKAGFIAKIIATPGSEENRNLLFLGLTEEKDFTKVNYTESGSATFTDLTQFFVNQKQIDENDALVLTDEKPQLGLLYAQAAMSWKKAYNSYYTKGFIEEKIN